MSEHRDLFWALIDKLHPFQRVVEPITGITEFLGVPVTSQTFASIEALSEACKGATAVVVIRGSMRVVDGGVCALMAIVPPKEGEPE